MARAVSIYLDQTTGRMQDSLGQALPVADLTLFLGETLDLSVYVRDSENDAVDLTGNTTGWNICGKDPADLDGSTLLFSKAAASVTAATGLVLFQFSGNDLNTAALSTYLADPLPAANYGKMVRLQIYTQPAADMVVYGAGVVLASRGARSVDDPAPLAQGGLWQPFGFASDGEALAYTVADGWTLDGVAMTTGAGWTVSGASLVLTKYMQVGTATIAAGGTLQIGADNTTQPPAFFVRGQLTNAGTIKGALVGVNTAGVLPATQGAGRSSNGNGVSVNTINHTLTTINSSGSGGAGGGTGTATGGSSRGYGHNSFWWCPRVAGGDAVSGTTGAGANGTSRSAAIGAFTDRDNLPRLPGMPGCGGGGGAATTGSGTATSGSGGAGGRAASICEIWAAGITNTGAISANGENGANGDAGATTGNGIAGGGGGGSAGAGGQVRLYYGYLGLTNTGTITATAGTSGTGGAGSASGSPNASYNGGNGGASADGIIIYQRVA